MNNDAHGGSRQVAMVGCDEAQAQAWGQRLSLMGCAPVSFDSSDDFLRAVTRGTQGSHFDLLLVVLKDEGAWPVLTSMCKALRLPIFLVANALQRELLAEVLQAAEPEAQGASIDFAVLPVDDFEVELRVREALRRNETLLHPPSVNALFGDYQFIGSRKVVVHKGQDIRLKPREFELALLLFRNTGRLLERDWLWARCGWTRRSSAGAGCSTAAWRTSAASCRCTRTASSCCTQCTDGATSFAMCRARRLQAPWTTRDFRTRRTSRSGWGKSPRHGRRSLSGLGIAPAAAPGRPFVDEIPGAGADPLERCFARGLLRQHEHAALHPSLPEFGLAGIGAFQGLFEVQPARPAFREIEVDGVLGHGVSKNSSPQAV